MIKRLEADENDCRVCWYIFRHVADFGLFLFGMNTTREWYYFHIQTYRAGLVHSSFLSYVNLLNMLTALRNTSSRNSKRPRSWNDAFRKP